MPSLHTANRHHRKALRRRVYEEGFAYHERRAARIAASGAWHKLNHSGYLRRWARRRKAMLRKGT